MGSLLRKELPADTQPTLRYPGQSGRSQQGVTQDNEGLVLGPSCTRSMIQTYTIHDPRSYSCLKK